MITTGQGTHGFTLDPQLGDFVLTHRWAGGRGLGRARGGAGLAACRVRRAGRPAGRQAGRPAGSASAASRELPDLLALAASQRPAPPTLVRRSIQIPKRGQIYSVNDARYHDWPQGLQKVGGLPGGPEAAQLAATTA